MCLSPQNFFGVIALQILVSKLKTFCRIQFLSISGEYITYKFVFKFGPILFKYIYRTVFPMFLLII